MSSPRTKIDPATLRDLPVDKKEFERHIVALQLALKSTKLLPIEKTILLSNLGNDQRVIGDLSSAESNLESALQLCHEQNLGVKQEVQIQVRLAIVMQWQKRFQECDINYDIIIELCRRYKEAEGYLDFALQHSGKSLFDQQKYKAALKRFEDALVIREKNQIPELIDSTKLAIKTTLARLGSNSSLKKYGRP